MKLTLLLISIGFALIVSISSKTKFILQNSLSKTGLPNENWIFSNRRFHMPKRSRNLSRNQSQEEAVVAAGEVELVATEVEAV